MFRSAKWRNEKNRIKAVFKLYFHATQVLQCGVDALVLSIVPGDIGRPTKRLEKAIVRDGNCIWENPACETLKFIQDPKTGKFNDKFYHFLLSTGLSKASTIGEVSINFADYANATKPFSVSLPFKNSHSDAVLHVSIQRLQENSDQREEDECENAKTKFDDTSLRNQASNGDTDESIRSYSSEDVSAKAIINGTSSGSDITLSSSDDSSGLDTPRQIGLRKTNIHSNTYRFVPAMSHDTEPQNPAVNTSTSMHDVHQRSHWDSSPGSELGSSIGDSKEMSQEAPSPLEIERLRAELVALSRQVEVSDMELQTLRKQIVKESKRGQDLTKEVIILKEEKNALKTECDNLRSFNKRKDDANARSKSQLESGDLHAFVEEIRQELNYEKDMNANLRLQLKKMQESNAELVLAVQDLEEMLEQKNTDTNSAELGIKLSKCETHDDDDDDEDQKALDELVKERSDAKETHLLEKKIIDLYGEIEMYRRDREELEMQIEQLALDYEILKQENHDISHKLEQSQLQEQLNIQCEYSSPPPPAAMNDLETHIENLENQLKEQSEEFSNSLATIKALQNHIRRLEDEMEKQAQGFGADIEAVTREKVEQEHRAIQAEEALRKTRLKNANTAERLQEEFQRLSMQMTSTFDENEKVTMKALTEANELRAQKSLLERMLHKVKEELQSTKDDYEVKLKDLSNQIDTMSVQVEHMLEEIEDKSKQLENQKKHGEQSNRDFSEEIEMLKVENEKLKVEISCLSEQVEGKETLRTELELMKKSIEESETLLERGNVERNELVNAIALLKKEAENSVNELNRMRHLIDEKETEARDLQSELKAIRVQCSDLKKTHVEDETEKEKLRKQVVQLKGEIKKKGDALTSVEKKFRDSNGRAQHSDGSKTTPINKRTASSPQNSKEIASLREKIKILEGLIHSKEYALETSTNSFLEKEKEFQTRIVELENKVEEFNRSIALQKDRSIIISNEKEVGTSRLDTADNNLSDILTELSSLKERNESMESELKEMQERYSEMSLKFAEVEGERQMLVMTVRNLKGIQKG